MVCPVVLLGMEQGDDGAGFGVEGCLPGGFVAVASGTGVTKVGEVGFATGGLGNDVFDFENSDGEMFGGLAVSTVAVKLGFDASFEVYRDVRAHARRW